MPQTLTALRVFIASPGDLGAERQRFRDEINSFNEQAAHPRGFVFIPVGWETQPGGIGRPQALINEDVRAADYLLLLLHKRWGSPATTEPDGPTGTEEEYNVARTCLADADAPMRDIAIGFKAVDPAFMADPGDQLKRVLAFKQELIEEKRLLFKEYDTEDAFAAHLRALLNRWLLTHETETKSAVPPKPAPATDFTTPALHDPRDVQALVKQAETALDSGDLVEAELILADAMTRGENAAVLRTYGALQQRRGLLESAEAFFQKALEISIRTKDATEEATSYTNVGNVYQMRGDLDRAEMMYRKALDLNEHLGTLEGQAVCYGNIGTIHYTRGDLDHAEMMYRKALDLNERIDRLQGMAGCYGNIGNVYDMRGDVDGAEAMYYKAMDLYERVGKLEGQAVNLGNLGNIRYTRGDLEGAEGMYRKALDLYERLGSLEGQARNFGNISNVYSKRGDLASAEEMYRKALGLNERLGNLEGQAANYNNLGLLFYTRGEVERAEAMYRKALGLHERLSSLAGRAIAYRNLGSVYGKRGDQNQAWQVWTTARDLYAKAQMPHRAAEMQALLDALAGTGGSEQSPAAPASGKSRRREGGTPRRAGTRESGAGTQKPSGGGSKRDGGAQA